MSCRFVNRHIRYIVVSSVISAICGLSQPVAAEERNCEDLILQAEEAYDRDNFASSAALYRQTFQQCAQAWTIFNEADCFDHMKQYKAAIRSYEEYLSVEKDPIAYKELIQAAKERIGKSKKLLARLVIEIEKAPPHVRVYINGEAVPNWNEGPIELDPGEVSISILCEGYHSWKKTINLAGGAQTARSVGPLSPLKMPAYLTIKDLPPKAKIFINGSSVVVGKSSSLERDPGDVEVEVRCDGYLPRKESVHLEGGVHTVLPMPLPRIPSTISVNCTAEKSRVYIDEMPVGSCPLKNKDITPGSHLLTVKAAGMKTHSQNFSGIDMRAVELSVNLKPIRWDIIGAVSLALGVASIGAGIGLAVGNKAEIDKANQAAENSKDPSNEIEKINAQYRSNELDYAAYSKQYDEKATEYNNHKQDYYDATNLHIGFQTGMIVGFAVGSVLTGVGVGFLKYYYSQNKKKERKHVFFTPASSFIVEF